jgi:hypothetical protein
MRWAGRRRGVSVLPATRRFGPHRRRRRSGVTDMGCVSSAASATDGGPSATPASANAGGKRVTSRARSLPASHGATRSKLARPPPATSASGGNDSGASAVDARSARGKTLNHATAEFDATASHVGFANGFFSVAVAAHRPDSDDGEEEEDFDGGDIDASRSQQRQVRTRPSIGRSASATSWVSQTSNASVDHHALPQRMVALTGSARSPPLPNIHTSSTANTALSSRHQLSAYSSADSSTSTLRHHYHNNANHSHLGDEFMPNHASQQQPEPSSAGWRSRRCAEQVFTERATYLACSQLSIGIFNLFTEFRLNKLAAIRRAYRRSSRA